ncbi:MULTISPECIES: FecR family protein [unclassified Ensifer]|uniref:FecR family protein n=1 Tax=unclassified Ensifer TaxID=2633371 RepID=UPI0007128CE3|nr:MULTISPECIES: FecR family protein [unclassified Ensifer]KQX42207.1 iron dicitrate transport regulator FecR [Ensifer sp. Root1298]KQX72018.1 iron dicitrate transport regulator FecR [Ensifer sp. Root1312]KRC15397.1 iron dicitrate transport regulator FecR [Ensifer sp. Root74]KRD78885.1 iron dicitrate transport regulator FecR [Ensifer sp. Root954]
MSGDRQTIDDSVLQAAAGWVARMQSEDATIIDRQAFERWLDEHADHRAAYEELRALWSDLGEVPIPEGRLGQLRAQRRRRVGGFVGLCLAAGVAILSLATPYGDRWRADYYTGVGEVRRIALEDGTQVDLNTDTALVVRYDQGQRKVRLLRGEAFFAVAKNPQRPFVVEDGSISATALGTRYSVGATGADRAADVKVEEGRVEVEAAGQKAILGAGEAATIDRQGRLFLTKTDVAAGTAWRDGKLVFSRRPLREVLSTLERYRRGRILLIDEKAGALEVSGIFDLHDTDDALSVLEASLPLRVLRLSGFMVLVQSR